MMTRGTPISGTHHFRGIPFTMDAKKSRSWQLDRRATPEIIHFNRIFHSKPSSELGVPGSGTLWVNMMSFDASDTYRLSGVAVLAWCALEWALMQSTWERVICSSYFKCWNSYIHNHTYLPLFAYLLWIYQSSMGPSRDTSNRPLLQELKHQFWWFELASECELSHALIQ